MVHNKIMKETTVIHRENECEWRFVGIWADMLDKSILDFDEENKKDYLVLFEEYDSPLQVLQENLRLRNLYNQFISNNSVTEIQKMEDEIKKQVKTLSGKSELFTYYKQADMLMKVVYKDSQLSYSL